MKKLNMPIEKKLQEELCIQNVYRDMENVF